MARFGIRIDVPAIERVVYVRCEHLFPEADTAAAVKLDAIHTMGRAERFG